MKPMILQEEHDDFADHEALTPVVFEDGLYEDEGAHDSVYCGDTEAGGTAMLTVPGSKTVGKVGGRRRRQRKSSGSPPNVVTEKTPKPAYPAAPSPPATSGKLHNMNRKKGNKQWVHPPEALLRGHIVYNVKFLGFVEVEQPKGTEIVKEAVRKMKFNKQLKKAEGHKPPKVELTVSVDGVTVQEPKNKLTKHQYPLHRISYCADDKTDKKLLTFIAKEAETNKHFCYVFDSEKCAEEVTLTIGQAFDLAYRKFLDSSSKDMDNKKQFLLMQKKVQQLTEENVTLKARVADLERLLEPETIDNFERNKNNKSSTPAPKADNPVVGRRLENLILDDGPFSNGTAAIERTKHNTPAIIDGTPILAPPPPVPSRSHHGTPATPTQKQASVEVDLFGSTPFTATPPAPIPSIPPRASVPPPASLPGPQGTFPSTPASKVSAAPQPVDPFGMGSFTPNNNTVRDLDQQILSVDRELMDLQAGFSQGISFENDFSLADLDPLNQK